MPKLTRDRAIRLVLGYTAVTGQGAPTQTETPAAETTDAR